MRTTTDLLQLRWRVGQWLLALVDGEKEQAAALIKAMSIEGIRRADMLDEFRLLLAQFGHRQRYHLVAEVERLWRKLRERCTRCERPSRYRDNDGVCWRCIAEEPE